MKKSYIKPTSKVLIVANKLMDSFSTTQSSGTSNTVTQSNAKRGGLYYSVWDSGSSSEEEEDK